ncbi:MAG: hypothetical protein QMD03_03455 [Syntrophales bacterium]|nr:hypothetical protein [Syntrophales bacterium]
MIPSGSEEVSTKVLTPISRGDIRLIINDHYLLAHCVLLLIISLIRILYKIPGKLPFLPADDFEAFLARYT